MADRFSSYGNDHDDDNFSKALAIMAKAAERNVSPSRLRLDPSGEFLQKGDSPTPPPPPPPPLPFSGQKSVLLGSARREPMQSSAADTDTLRAMLGMSSLSSTSLESGGNGDNLGENNKHTNLMDSLFLDSNHERSSGSGGTHVGEANSFGGDDGGAGAALLSMLQTASLGDEPSDASEPVTTSKKKKKKKKKAGFLVLLDMNGTLLLRLKGRLGEEPPNFHHAGLNYFLRDGVVELVQALRAHPRCTLAFYTSMRESNALPAVLHITGGMRVEIYDREYNRADTARKDSKSWDTMRDMEKIWSTSGRAGCGFDATCTIMVDDTDRKMRHAPDNLVRVPEFKEAQHRNDNAMHELRAYLSTLLDTCDGDVRKYMLSRPFKTSG